MQYWEAGIYIDEPWPSTRLTAIVGGNYLSYSIPEDNIFCHSANPQRYGISAWGGALKTPITSAVTAVKAILENYLSKRVTGGYMLKQMY